MATIEKVDISEVGNDELKFYVCMNYHIQIRYCI